MPRRRRPWTLRGRLVAALVALAALGLGIGGAVSVVLLQDSLMQRVDQQLGGVSNGLHGGPPPPRAQDNSARHGLPTSFRAIVLDQTGQTVAVLGTAPGGTDLPVLPSMTILNQHLISRTPFTAADSAGGSNWRMLVISTPDGQLIAVALSLEDTYAALNHLVVIELAVGGAVLVLLGLVGTLVVRVGLRPLTRIEHTATAIAGGEVDRRIDDADDRTETGRLGSALNTMLGRISSALRDREQSQQRLRDFVADASHELRTPLTSIRGFAELYRRGGATEKSDVDKLMARIESEATRMGRLVDDMLLLARMDQERSLDLAEVDLLAIADDAVQDAHACDPERKVTLAAPHGAQFVLGDEHRLRQVVANLMNNALVHTPPGTPVSVTVDRLWLGDSQPGDSQPGDSRPGDSRPGDSRPGDSRPGDSRNGSQPLACAGEPVPGAAMAVVEVTDSGPGVPQDQAPRVFDRFYRVRAAGTPNRIGSGLGLAIAAAIVSAHRGRIELRPAPGSGARFRILLPTGE
jgi:two-component system OmpR family sensor kinase